MKGRDGGGEAREARRGKGELPFWCLKGNLFLCLVMARGFPPPAVCRPAVTFVSYLVLSGLIGFRLSADSVGFIRPSYNCPAHY